MTKPIILILIILISGCNADDKKINNPAPFETIKIDFEPQEELVLSDFLSELHYHQLETDGQLMGQAERVIFNNKYIAVFDDIKNSIWLFDRNLNFINVIHIPNGKGPGELEYFRDISFGPDGSIYGMGIYKVIKFDVSGNLLKEIQFPFYAFEFTVLPNHNFVFHLDNRPIPAPGLNGNYNLIYTDSSGNILKGFAEQDPRKKGMTFLNFESFPVYKESRYVFITKENYIYELKNDEAVIKYEIDFGDRAIPDELFDKAKNYDAAHEFDAALINTEDYLSLWSRFIETDKFIFIVKIMKGINYHIVYSKSSKKIVHGYQLINDIDNTVPPYFFTAIDNQLYGIVDASRLLNSIDEETVKTDSRLSDIKNNFDPLGNPVLVISK